MKQSDTEKDNTFRKESPRRVIRPRVLQSASKVPKRIKQKSNFLKGNGLEAVKEVSSGEEDHSSALNADDPKKPLEETKMAKKRKKKLSKLVEDQKYEDAIGGLDQFMPSKKQVYDGKGLSNPFISKRMRKTGKRPMIPPIQPEEEKKE